MGRFDDASFHSLRWLRTTQGVEYVFDRIVLGAYNQV
jgi:hypothetical protein